MEKTPSQRRLFSRNTSLFCKQYVLPVWRFILFVLYLGLAIGCFIIAAAMDYNNHGFGHDLFVSFAVVFIVLSLWKLRKIF